MIAFRPIASRLLLFAILAFPAISAEAQSSKPPEDKVIQALLNEVRLLRETLQRINLSAYRTQIIVERVRAQNDRVARLTRTLEDTREGIATAQAQLNQLTELAKSAESNIDQESDSKQRSQLELEHREFKHVLDNQKQMTERLRERELRLNAELQAEQGKLSDLEGRLDALEREIENELERQRSASREKTDKQ